MIRVRNTDIVFWKLFCVKDSFSLSLFYMSSSIVFHAIRVSSSRHPSFLFISVASNNHPRIFARRTIYIVVCLDHACSTLAPFSLPTSQRMRKFPGVVGGKRVDIITVNSPWYKRRCVSFPLLRGRSSTFYALKKKSLRDT